MLSFNTGHLLDILKTYLLGGSHIYISSGSGSGVLEKFHTFHSAMIPCFFVHPIMPLMVMLSLDLGVWEKEPATPLGLYLGFVQKRKKNHSSINQDTDSSAAKIFSN